MKTIKWVSIHLTALLTFLTSPLLKAEVLDKVPAFFENPQLDVLSYQVKSEIQSLSQSEIPMTLNLRFKVIQCTRNVELHYEASSIKLDLIKYNDLDLEFTSLPGQPNKHGLSGSVLLIKFPRDLDPQKTYTVQLHYQVKVGTDKNFGVYHLTAENNFGRESLLTRSWPYYSRFWLPGNDAPADGAKISYQMTLPKGLKLIANGKFDSINDNCREKSESLKICTWSLNSDTTTYNYFFAIGEFDQWNQDLCFDPKTGLDNKIVGCREGVTKIPVAIYYNAAKPKTDFALEKIKNDLGAIVYFSKLFGVTPFESLGFLLSPYAFSMESTGMIVLNRAQSTVHEIVHQWWGNHVLISHWGDFWISEGFTTFLTSAYEEYVTQVPMKDFENANEDLNYAHNTDPNDIFNSTPYQKGAQSLLDLRKSFELLSPTPEIGKDVFWSLLKDLFTEYRQKKLSTQEFVEFVKQRSPQLFKSRGIETPGELQQRLSEWSLRWYVLGADS